MNYDFLFTPWGGAYVGVVVGLAIAYFLLKGD